MASEVREQERVLVASLVRAGIAGSMAGGYLTEAQGKRLDDIVETALNGARDYERRCVEDRPKKKRRRRS